MQPCHPSSQLSLSVDIWQGTLLLCHQLPGSPLAFPFLLLPPFYPQLTAAPHSTLLEMITIRTSDWFSGPDWAFPLADSYSVMLATMHICARLIEGNSVLATHASRS